MAFAHAPLSPAELGPGVARVFGPQAAAPLRAMVAQGLAPLPPRDLVVALYQLWATNDPEHGGTAATTARNLPAPLVTGALGDAALPPGVLDFLSRQLLKQDALLEKVLRHPQVHDDTLAAIARVCSESMCEVLADNQARWLAAPVIVAQLYQNPKCRMSTIHRVIELAERQSVDIDMPAIEEIRVALRQSKGPDAARDRAFGALSERRNAEAQARAADALQAASVAEEPDLDELLRVRGRRGETTVDDGAAEASADGFDLDAALAGGGELDLPGDAPEADPLASLGREAPGDGLDLPDFPDEEGADEVGELAAEIAAAEGAPPEGADEEARSISQMSPMEKIRLALIGTAFDRSLLVRDSNKVVALAAIKSPKVQESEAVAYAGSRAISPDVIRYISQRREWIKLYSVKLALVMNPKCPMSTAMTFLGHLHKNDLKKVARSKGIPSALATAAKRKLNAQR
jgi:hypothetical protein